MKKQWKLWLLAGLGIVGMSGFFLAVMRPPGGQLSAPGQDMPWQIVATPDGATSTVFGLTLNASTVQDAVAKWGRRYELGLFQDQKDQLSLEAYFRDAVIGGLNARLVLSARLPRNVLDGLRARAGKGSPTADSGWRYPVLESDQALGLKATIVAITYLPVAKFDPDLVRKRFGEPAEQIKVKDGAHWLYPALGLDVLLGDSGEALLQYVAPPTFQEQLRAPLHPSN